MQVTQWIKWRFQPGLQVELNIRRQGLVEPVLERESGAGHRFKVRQQRWVVLEVEGRRCGWKDVGQLWNFRRVGPVQPALSQLWLLALSVGEQVLGF